MKKILMGTVLTTVLLAATTASAEQITGDVYYQDVYRTITKQIPNTQNICQTVDIPIYGRVGGGASAGDVLGGMIIGGLIGKGITGKDNGAAAGAVIGGMYNADKNQGSQQVIGYRQQQQCNRQTTYTTESNEVYSHSYVTFYLDGRQQRVKFNRY